MIQHFLTVFLNTAVSKKVVLQVCNSKSDNVERVLFSYLIEALRCFTVIEGNSRNTCIQPFFFLLAETPCASSTQRLICDQAFFPSSPFAEKRNAWSQRKTITTHNTNRHCRACFTLLFGNLSQNSFSFSDWGYETISAITYWENEPKIIVDGMFELHRTLRRKFVNYY